MEILEYCDPEDVLKREQYYIDLLKPEYNILKTAGSLFGFRHTEETKAQMSADRKGKNHPLFGKQHSEETKTRISKALTGKNTGENHPLFGKKHSEETKKRMSETKNTKNNIAGCVETDETSKIYSMKKAESNACKQPGSPFLGKTHSKESRAAIGMARVGIKQSEETKLAISLSQPNIKKIEVTDIDTNIITIYRSINQAAKAINCRDSAIRYSINSKKQIPYKGRYLFRLIAQI